MTRPRTEEVRVEASVGGRRLTLDPIRVLPITLELREVESLVPCGLQLQWGEGANADGEKVELCVGAGLGSRWGTLTYGERQFCFDAELLVNEFVRAVKADGGSE